MHRLIDPTFFEGRAAEIILRTSASHETRLGVFGVLHPEILAHYNLPYPVCALEFNVESFL